MKKIFLASAIALSMSFTTSMNAQNALTNILQGAAQAAANSSDAKSAGQNALGSVLNQAAGAANNSSLGQASNGLLGNLIASVTGSATTTQGNLIGNWSYAQPSVQFESENLLTQAGGTTIAQKVEDKLAKAYKLVGIKPDKLFFNFQKDGKVTYGVSKITREGTYVFNNNDKTVTITTNTGSTLKAYVTVSGDQMALTFEAKKMLELMSTISSKFQSLKTVDSLIKQYTGAKVGFEFNRK